MGRRRRVVSGDGLGSLPAPPEPALPIDPTDPNNPLDQMEPSATPPVNSSPAPAAPSGMPTPEQYHQMNPGQQRRVLNTYGQPFLDSLEQYSQQQGDAYNSAPEPPGYIGLDAFMGDPNVNTPGNSPDVMQYQGAMHDWMMYDGSGPMQPASSGARIESLPFEYNHPDDQHFMNFGNTVGPTATYPMPTGSMSSDYRNYMTNFGSNASPFSAYPNLSAASMGYGSRPPDNAQVLIGDEQPSGYGIPPSLDPSTGQVIGTPDAPAGPVLDPEALAGATTSTTAPGASQSASPQQQPRIGVGSNTAMNANLGTSANPLFGVGQNSGQRYFNTGSGWQPIGQAPADVRWAANSGTGNAQATATTNAFVLGGGYAGAPNNMRGTDESGRTQFTPASGFTGSIDPDTELLSRVHSGALQPKQYVMPTQSEAWSQNLTHNDPASVDRYNQWIMAHNPGRGTMNSIPNPGGG